VIPYDINAYQLLHQGSLALARVEGAGLRIDEKYLDNAIIRTQRRIKRLKARNDSSEIMKLWRKKYKRKTNINSTVQLGDILFNEMGYKSTALTSSGKPKTDEKALTAIDHPFVQSYLEIKKLEKAVGTYLKGVKREVVDGYVHPVFNLHLASTFRSSSDSPNFQNIPIRNEEIGKLVRTAFIARKGRHLVELDYSGIEVRVAACYHKDPVMIEYICDETKDMHRDMAMECYRLSQDEVTKKVRYCGKNMFVFPQFYGDWYLDCARSLWEAIDSMHLETASGTPLKEHLKSQGIKRLGDLDPKEKPVKGTFEHHIQQVEKHFWEKRFSVYARWKQRWVKKYQERGWMKTKTGFICQGYMKRNEIINYPVQGSAFHCLLWSLIQLVLKELRKRHMKTLIVGQIHDSIVADVPHEELDDFLALANYVMTKKLTRRWKWINVPLEIEAEVTPVDGNWSQKKEVEICH